MRQHGVEVFPDYKGYLNQSTRWPSESADKGFYLIGEMVPRYAASALQKLLRWAGTHYAVVALNIANASDRIAFVRSSALGQALAERAQGLDPNETIQKLDDELEAVSTLEMATTFAAILQESFRDTSTERLLSAALHLAQTAEDRWTVKSKSR